MFHSESSLSFLAPAAEPGHQALFREELAQAAPAAPKLPTESAGADNELILARHLMDAAAYIRFI